MQAEALKEKDKVIAHLRHDLQQLQGQPHVKTEPRDDDIPTNSPHRLPTSSTAPTRPLNIRQRRFQGGMLNDSIYFGTPGTTGVVEEVSWPRAGASLSLTEAVQFANLSVNGQPANLTHLVPRGADMAAFQIQPTNPFPTFWRTAEGTSALINLLPKDQQETLFYINTFQHRAQSCSFPHLPDQCTESEVQRFLSNVKENSEQHPDMLALIFATLAQGAQNGAYDKLGGTWHGQVMESQCRMGDAFSKHFGLLPTSQLTCHSRCFNAMPQACFVLQSAQTSDGKNPCHAGTVPYKQWEVPRCLGIVRYYHQTCTEHWS